MFTEIEGEWDEVFAVVKAATEAVLPFGSRVSLVLKADIRPGRTGELDGKIERLEQALTEAGDAERVQRAAKRQPCAMVPGGGTLPGMAVKGAPGVASSAGRARIRACV